MTVRGHNGSHAQTATTTARDNMIHRENNTIRPRNVEDINELEEKGLLRRVDDDSPEPSPTRRRGKGKEKETRLEKVLVEEEYSTGLTTRRDKEAFALLVLLYLLQGVPLGLTFGTLPFLLKSHLSYSQLAIFALSTWPYSLKLLWSPIVDAWFVKKWGRRKSWIVPVQGLVGLGMWVIGGKIEEWLNVESVDVKFLTAVFGSLILAAATQDIAVDGWALTLLSQPNLSYASTAQTIGIGIGNALSFTVFLAFNSIDFSNKYFRSPSQPLDYPLVSLGGYMRFWAVVFVGVTVGLAVLKKEDPPSEDDPDMDVKKVYKVMWSIVRLKNIQTFLFVHLICKIGFQVNDSVTSLKLLEKGLSKEDLAVAVLLDFPAQMAVGWLAAKWSRPVPSSHPLTTGGGGRESGNVLKPWLYAFWARLAMAAISTLVVAGFPSNRAGSVGTTYFLLIIATTLFSSLTSTVQFVGICAFHTQIADPLIGGTYMTLLNTVSNLGGTWPKPLILRSVDMLTVATCSVPSGSTTSLGSKPLLSQSASDLGECVTEHGKNLCAQAGGECIMQRDGYYIMSAVCVTLGAGLLIVFILPMVRRLAALPMSAWRVKIPN
ncbi:transporter protein [Cryptococcus neoformans C23]|uniref:Acetyl-CoA transporter n=1 Tax=Cryptococcus neoformans (strain H99 / ATCC 208821 / CBS 10515 / FGSC 9487) TaxID=235443 RepID=J9VWY7_CRYN9|nr:acetyl-CoA transporter [Cryptococcus neoformans var. grubii H99]AUB28970.1 acetyl-CoA transporter [Cryptococcus neoformans var. grubii]OWZ26590.1 transporter protein [Cryptococcus neoformans var. grubii AD1-83a]OWZ38348.1 transporter protein [Cryptococcus neoformans var. grubii C23]OWZ49889.1 transporter protein [Cryptococcus neoformans var. grubii 125.91]OXG43734.1 transporter protein [Cryptococcus neoformans var. grubii MW-RSA1955]OXG47818.1 transporter protein [Cryptococcus neoformans v|eukprot:XP_012053572.1 acetyl-CoA transporter [Cryptococcus neoformans var. grubii H99]